MSQWDKLLARIKALDRDLRFEELSKILEYFGYEMFSPRSGSSHYTFRKEGKRSVTIPKHRTIKKPYLEIVRRIVEEESANENSR